MTQYREYAGLLGERVRVPAHSIAKPVRIHSGEAYPFVRAAARLGSRERERFAHIAQFYPLFEQTMANRSVRAMMAAAGA